MATIRDVAKLAGVGVGTVSRVISGRGSVSGKTYEKVQQAIEELQYRPSSVARSLSSKSQSIVGLWLPHFLGPFHSTVLSSIEHELRKYGKHLVATSGRDYVSEYSPLFGLEFLIDRECDGIIIAGYGISDFDVAQALTRYPNLVLLNRTLPAIDSQCFDMDHVMGGRLAADYFLSKGHQCFACFNGPTHNTLDARQRFHGFQSRIVEAGYDLPLTHVTQGEYEYQTGSDGVDQLLDRQIPFTALFCGNDLIAMGAMARLHQRGKRVPEDVAVIGYDNSDFTDYTIPGLTSVKMPLEQASLAASRKILNLCYQHDFEISADYQPELVIRGSAG